MQPPLRKLPLHEPGRAQDENDPAVAQDGGAGTGTHAREARAQRLDSDLVISQQSVHDDADRPVAELRDDDKEIVGHALQGHVQDLAQEQKRKRLTPELNRTLPSHRPDASPGEAVGGWQRVGDNLSGGPFDRLLFAEDLTTYEKIRLFRQLTPQEQKSYLRQIPAEERDPFLKALGREGRWIARDLVLDTRGSDLEQFGYRFFEGEPQGFSPERFASVGPDYVIGPGDTLKISIWGNVEANVEATVDRGGNLTLPKVGSVHLWGQTFTEASFEIPEDWPYMYIELEDGLGRRAWTNSLFTS